MDEDLQRSLEELEAAMDHARSHVELNLESIDEGLFEEGEGESTQEDPGPKVDRIAELSEKLQGLEERADDPTAVEHIASAREHLQSYMKRHPQGG